MNTILRLLPLFSVPWLAAACGSDEATIIDESGNGPEAGGDRPTNPAVMVGVVGTNPEGRQTYVGVFPGVPSGEVTAAGMREFGDAYFSVYDGSIFVFEREQGEILRFEAD